LDICWQEAQQGLADLCLRPSGQGNGCPYVRGKRDLVTVMRLKQRLKALGVTCGQIASDDLATFLKAFQDSECQAEKQHTVGIEENNCRLQFQIRRAVPINFCFSNKMLYRLKAFAIGFFYINYGRI